MAIDQTCTIILSGKKESPDTFNVKTIWEPVLDMNDEANNHPSVISAFAGFIKVVTKNSNVKGSTVVRK